MSVPELFNLDLNEFKEGASTTSFGKRFQALTTLFEKNICSDIGSRPFLKSFRLFPRVVVSSITVKIFVDGHSVQLI